MFALACWIVNLFFPPLVYLTLCWTISLFLLFSKVWFWFCLLVLVIPLLPFTPKSGHSNYQDQGQYWYKAFFNVSKTCKRSDVIFQRIYYADKRIFIFIRNDQIFLNSAWFVLYEIMGNHNCISSLDTIEFLLFALFTCCISEITCCEMKMELVPNAHSHYMHLFSTYFCLFYK